jgi:predicted nucleic acid-binding protein
LSKGVIVEDRCFLDTNILVDVSRKKGAAIAFLEQAVTALQYFLPLYTLNTKHFQILPGLDVRRPY